MSTTNFPQDTYSASDIAKADYNADQSFTTTRARALKELDLINLEKSMAVQFATVTTQATGAAGALVFQFSLWVTDWMIGKKLNVQIMAAMDANGGDWWARDITFNNNGTSIAVDNTGALVTSGPSELSIDDDLLGVRDISIQGKVDSGSDTLSLRSDVRASVWVAP